MCVGKLSIQLCAIVLIQSAFGYAVITPYLIIQNMTINIKHY